MRVVLLVGLFLSGCSASNIKGDWDCPVKKGLGCVTISEADRHANSMINSDLQPKSKEVRLGKEKYKVYFGEYTDRRGNVHEKSIIRVSQDVK